MLGYTLEGTAEQAGVLGKDSYPRIESEVACQVRTLFHESFSKEVTLVMEVEASEGEDDDEDEEAEGDEDPGAEALPDVMQRIGDSHDSPICELPHRRRRDD
jgi:hypothetical protein